MAEKKKIALIEKENPFWRDLSTGWFDEMDDARSVSVCHPEERSELPCHPEERSDEGSALITPKLATKSGQ